MQHSESPSAEKPSQELRRAAKRKLSQSCSREDSHITWPSETSTSTPDNAPSVPPILSKKPKMGQPSFSSAPKGAINHGPVKISNSDMTLPSKHSQPQIGIRRLVIKNLRKAPSASVNDHYIQSWADISDALDAVLTGQQPRLPLDRLYRHAE